MTQRRQVAFLKDGFTERDWGRPPFTRKESLFRVYVCLVPLRITFKNKSPSRSPLNIGGDGWT